MLVPLAGCTSTALWSSLKVRTALLCLPFESGTATRLKEVSSARPNVATARITRRTEIILFTVLKVYRKPNHRAGLAGCPISGALGQRACPENVEG